MEKIKEILEELAEKYKDQKAELVLMLLFFLQFYYVRPLNRIATALKLHSIQSRKYTVDFDGDDQLKQINDGIRSLSEDNDQLRRRITALKAGAKSE